MEPLLSELQGQTLFTLEKCLGATVPMGRVAGTGKAADDGLVERDRADAACEADELTVILWSL